MDLRRAFDLNKFDIARLSDDQLRGIVGQVVSVQYKDRQENQLLYYKPVSPVAEAVHTSRARYLCIGGGNGASKTDTLLAHVTALATGIFPQGLKPEVLAAWKAQFRGPVNVRVVVESLTTTLEPIILPKLQWWQWSGVDEPGGLRGHWGWIPRRCLRDGMWVRCWRSEPRILRVLCFNPDNPGEVMGESTFQFMAHNQEASSFASGDFHHVVHDELTTYPIWRENEARTMRVGGRMAIAFTWPDDPAIPVDWVYDQLYEKGQPGPAKNPDIDWFEMWSLHNKNLALDSVRKQAEAWSPEVAAVRIHGQPIRFSNRVHPLFTRHTRTWCVGCKAARGPETRCERCAGETPPERFEYNHVKDFAAERSWPAVFLLDPHPRKPHMMLWVQVDTWDDWWVVAEAEVAGGPDEVMAKCREVETELGLRIAARIGDRNMLSSPSGAQRGVSWQQEFDDVGLRCDLSDVSDVGRSRVNEMLVPDPDRKAPRFHIHPRCAGTVRQMERYVWDDYRNPEGKAQKQIAKDKDDDFPTLLKYLGNAGVTFRGLVGGARTLKTR